MRGMADTNTTTTRPVIAIRAHRLAASVGVDLTAQAPADRRVFIELAEATEALGIEYFDLVVAANLDWQVAEYVRNERVQHLHSSHEVKAHCVRRIAGFQHSLPVFDAAVASY